MLKKTLLIVAVVVFTQSVMGQAARSFTKKSINKRVSYKWTANNARFQLRESLEEDFEGYDDFTLDFSPWTTADVDGSETYGILDHDFPNSGSPMAYIVFNPSGVTPSMGSDEAIRPHSGSKFAACFASTTPPNDDWIITPAIALGSNSSLSFWVKSYTEQYGLERYKVGVSTTDNNPSSFTIISGNSYLEAPSAAWQEKQFDLSAYDGMEVYIGIQCVSNDAFIFMLDDLTVDSETTAGTLYGKVTDALTGDPIPDALVSVAGISDYTDANGDYSITGIPAGVLNANFTATPTSGTAPLEVQFTDLSSEGTHTVTASHEGYVDYSNSQVVIPDGGSLELAISLSPALATGQMRFVLTWGQLPRDLDSHLKTPEIDLQIPTVGTGRYWDVCTVNGATGVVNIINTITEDEPGRKSFDIMPPKMPASGREIISWDWDFGDGSSSTLQNPSYTYTSNGIYSVSLTVSDGTTNKTETKIDMIVVGPDGVDDLYEAPVSIYPNPVQNQLNIEAESLILEASVYNMNGQKVAYKTNASKTLQMDLSDLSSGTYILTITTEKGILQMKFNKAH